MTGLIIIVLRSCWSGAEIPNGRSGRSCGLVGAERKSRTGGRDGLAVLLERSGNPEREVGTVLRSGRLCQISRSAMPLSGTPGFGFSIQQSDIQLHQRNSGAAAVNMLIHDVFYSPG